MPLSRFHPAVRTWFETDLGHATDVQRRAWPAIGKGGHTLIAAPTGSGKTLAAFLSAVDDLVRLGLRPGGLADETTVLYVSPLRALSNDIQRNLQGPLAGIRERLAEAGGPDVEIRAWVRTGDTPPAERERMRRRPPHIVVTTPESLYLLLTSESGREILSTVRTVIVDEIHAVAASKRGSHLALSLERLEAVTGEPPQRIGLSATQRPIEALAGFLAGASERCSIVDTGHIRDWDLAIETPGAPLSAVMANEVWEELYDRLAELIAAERTTLIFVNTRRLCERLTRHLAERLGEEAVTAHHGSLAREHRLEAERRLKQGELRALVATASLELGIDIGDVDLVCQLGSPRAISTLLQRVGRSGHGVGGLSRGRLFPLTRDDLVECAALMDGVHRGELDRIRMPEAPVDVLAQQIVAEVAAAGDTGEEALYHRLAAAWPYRGLSREAFSDVVRMLAEGFTTRRGRRSAYLHRDAVNGRLRPRRGARLVALTNGGAIPDQFDYDVMLQPEGLRVGSVNEDFAFESMPGDIFQLGNTSYRIRKVESGRVFVEDAGGAPPTIPFWFGEAPGRTDELSAAVSRLRAGAEEHLRRGGPAEAREWLREAYRLTPRAADEIAGYLGAAQAALGRLPTREHLVLERFFDEAGDMHLVIHSPYGSRVNRAWGLALRKRFCRRFNFELQAAALEDSIVLSLGPTHSFPLEEVTRYLGPATARDVLVQALLDAPMFGTRWRWNASVALAVHRNRNGRRRPAQLQRQDAEDLVSVIFPDQLACAENLSGAREIPDHPLVRQTVHDCLTDVMDVDGMERLLAELERGGVTFSACDLAAPSPLAEEIINARPYAFLDDAPQEERRTLSVASGSGRDLAEAARLGRPDPEAIARVRSEAWLDPRDADELHDALTMLGYLTAAEGRAWEAWFRELTAERRATEASLPGGGTLWVAAERLAELQALEPSLGLRPAIDPVPSGPLPEDAEAALTELVRSRLEGLGPVEAESLRAPLGVSEQRLEAALARLQTEGFAVQGRFEGNGTQWCERGLLARIHRYTIQRRRAEVEPVSTQDFMRFLLEWQGVTEPSEGVEALAGTLEQLEGFAVSAAAWETDVLPARVAGYAPGMLDQLLSTGRFTWLRLTPPAPAEGGPRRPGPVRQTPVVLVERAALPHWRRIAPAAPTAEAGLSGGARRVLEALESQGASFFADLVGATGMLRTQVEEALGELVACGLASSDTFNGLRALIAPASRRPAFAPRGRRRGGRVAPGVDAAGRWVRLGEEEPEDPAAGGRMTDPQTLEHVAWVLLSRYGVVFRRLLEREAVTPSWRELLYMFRRLEARGEVRGGRFVQEFAGEQFAHPEAVGALRRVRRRDRDGRLAAVSAADPLNLVGVLTPGGRIPAVPSNRLLYRDGVPVALFANGEVRFLEELPPAEQWEARRRLLGRHGGPGAGSAAVRTVD